MQYEVISTEELNEKYSTNTRLFGFQAIKDDEIVAEIILDERTIKLPHDKVDYIGNEEYFDAVETRIGYYIKRFYVNKMFGDVFQLSDFIQFMVQFLDAEGYIWCYSFNSVFTVYKMEGFGKIRHGNWYNRIRIYDLAIMLE